MFKLVLSSFGYVGVVLFVLTLLIVFPLLTIWSANTLFPVLAIPYTIDTWVATCLLGMFFRGSSNSKIKE